MNGRWETGSVACCSWGPSWPRNTACCRSRRGCCMTSASRGRVFGEHGTAHRGGSQAWSLRSNPSNSCPAIQRRGRPTVRVTFATILLTTLLSACGGGAAPAGMVVRDSAGIAIHVYRGPDVALPWTFTPTTVLGGAADGPGSFYRLSPGQLGSDADGHVYVLSTAENVVEEFDSLGAPVRTFGRQGEGPGELESPSSLAIRSDGTVAVFDFGRMALVTFEPDGRAGPVVSFPFPPKSFTQVHFASWGGG